MRRPYNQVHCGWKRIGGRGLEEKRAGRSSAIGGWMVGRPERSTGTGLGEGRRAEGGGKAGHRFDVGFDVPTRHRVQRHDGRSLPSAPISPTLQQPPYPLGR